MSCGVSLPVKRTSPFIEKTLKDPEPPMFRFARYPGISLDVLERAYAAPRFRFARYPGISLDVLERAYAAPRADMAV
jgi:hypothetical protein